MRRVWIGAAILTLAVAVAATRVDFLQGSFPGGARAPTAAPEFRGIARWLNSEPLTVADLRGSVVLVDFWTFSCVNCVRTFPFLRALYARYRSAGLRIVGVHSPEFAFEREVANVEGAIRRHGLRYPVAMDNEMETWRAYRNNYWPHVYLIDASGRIRFDHIGEGGEGEIEEHVRALLAEAAALLPDPVGMRGRAPSRRLTPEIYAGRERGGLQGSLANQEGYRGGGVVDYAPVGAREPAELGTGGFFFLEGRWRAEEEFVRAEEDGARVRLRFFAADVFAVAGGEVIVRVLLDGRAGDPVRVTREDLFPLVRLGEPGEHELTLEVDRGFRLYTFTFG